MTRGVSQGKYLTWKSLTDTARKLKIKEKDGSDIKDSQTESGEILILDRYDTVQNLLSLSVQLTTILSDNIFSPS